MGNGVTGEDGDAVDVGVADAAMVGADAVDGDADAIVASRRGSIKLCVPQRLTWKLKLPKVRSAPEWRSANAGRVTGECGLNPMVPKYIGAMIDGVGECRVSMHGHREYRIPPFRFGTWREGG